jgi:hypothetical protein
MKCRIWFAWVGLVPLVGAACGSAKNTGYQAVVDAGTTRDASVADVITPDTADAADEVATDTGGSLFGDGATSEAGGCNHLNIGIFGNPGANASSDFQAWLTAAGTSVQRIQNMAPTAEITAATLQPFDVVILDWLTRDYTVAEATVFASWISSGHGIVSMSGYDNVTTDDWHANSLLAPLEVAYSGPLLNGPVTTFATHPITMGLTSVTFDGGYQISDLGGGASTRTPIAFLPDPEDAGNVPVAYAVQMGNGRAFVWGDEWISFDSEWSTLPEIKQLWVQVFAWIAPTNSCGLQPQ